MYIHTVISLIFLSAIMLAVFAYFFYFIRSFFTGDHEAPYVSTFPSQFRLMQKELTVKPHSKVIDLGCGDGKALRFFQKHFAPSQTVGYDINFFAIQRGKTLNYLTGYSAITLIHNKFEQANLSRYDYIYIYLFTKQVAEIEQRVFDNKKPDAVVVCNTFPCIDHKPYHTLIDESTKIYLYK